MYLCTNPVPVRYEVLQIITRRPFSSNLKTKYVLDVETVATQNKRISF